MNPGSGDNMPFKAIQFSPFFLSSQARRARCLVCSGPFPLSDRRWPAGWPFLGAVVTAVVHTASATVSASAASSVSKTEEAIIVVTNTASVFEFFDCLYR